MDEVRPRFSLEVLCSTQLQAGVQGELRCWLIIILISHLCATPLESHEEEKIVQGQTPSTSGSF